MQLYCKISSLQVSGKHDPYSLSPVRRVPVAMVSAIGKRHTVIIGKPAIHCLQLYTFADIYRWRCHWLLHCLLHHQPPPLRPGVSHSDCPRSQQRWRWCIRQSRWYNCRLGRSIMSSTLELLTSLRAFQDSRRAPSMGLPERLLCRCRCNGRGCRSRSN